MQILVWTTVALTYLLMVWGNVVSATGSGLACPDWPTCYGTIFPPLSFPVILEWGHRLLAFVTSTFILVTLFKVFTSRRKNQTYSLIRSGQSLLALLGIQILLGAVTVLLELSVVASTIHLLIATLVFSGLITIACVTTWGNPVVKGVSPKVRRLSCAAIIGLFVQLALGGVVRHTHAGLACPSFPNCADGFFPDPLILETAVAFIHRWWGVLMIGVFVQLALAAAKTSAPLARPSRQALGLAVAQILLGIGTVMGRLNSHSRATHAAVGYALWGILFYVALRAGNFQWLWKKSGRSTS